MTQRPVSALAMLFGIMTLIGVLLPWHSHVVEHADGSAELLSSLRGYEGDFYGLVTMILAGLGTGSLIWFVATRTFPGLSRTLLLASLLAFAVGIGLTLVDLQRELPERTFSSGGRTETVGRAAGMMITMVSCALAFLMSAIAFLSPKTPYRD